ncbi:MAG TPA: hypothetical protein PLI66_02140 [Spirochaetales bacterium]|nr:hypothetical protein [Spirochaetales bacterium]
MKLSYLVQIAAEAREAYETSTTAGAIVCHQYGQELYDGAVEAAREKRPDDPAYRIIVNYMAMLDERGGKPKLERDGTPKINRYGEPVLWPTRKQFRESPFLDFILINAIERLGKAAEGESLGL